METGLARAKLVFEPDVMADRQRAAVVSSDWRERLPVLRGAGVTLRALQRSDAPVLSAMLATEEVTRSISPPPTTVEGFERFITWTERQRAEGRHLCFGIVPDGCDAAIGLIQVRALEPGFATAEWGFAIGSPFWGTGIFQKSARMVVDFAIEVVGAHRLEARASVSDGRGNAALRKLGAVEEGLLRKSFLRGGLYSDQILWSILEDDWLQAKTVWGGARPLA